MADLYALHWNAVTHANEYIVEVNPGGSGWATLGTTSGTQYTVVNTSTAYQSNIKYRVKAKDTTGVYDDSPYSEELSITYYSITNTLTNCTSDNIQQMVANGFTYNSIITVSDGYIIGSDNWNITIGGTSDKTKGTLSSDGKTLNVAILSANGNIVITASAALEAPAAPTITLSGSTISWAAVTGAAKYGIAATKDGITQQAETVNLSYDLSTWSALTVGTWTVSVKSGKEDAWSTPSNSVTYTVQNNLATPTIAMNADGKTLEITDVADATSYDVYVDGTMKTNVAKTQNVFNLDTSNVSIPYENYAYFEITFGDGTTISKQLGDSASIGSQYSTNYPIVSNPIPNVVKIRLYTLKDYPSTPYIRMKTSGTVLDERQQGGSIELSLTADTSVLILNGDA